MTVAMQKARVEHPGAYELLQKNTAPMGHNRIEGYEPNPEKAQAVRSEFISAVREIASNGGFSRTAAFRKAQERATFKLDGSPRGYCHGRKPRKGQAAYSPKRAAARTVCLLPSGRVASREGFVSFAGV
jgi:hypothetical protein